MAGNKNLNAAARAKKDEFYTQLDDIERELTHDEYIKFFEGKTILCNCDDPYESEFFKFFAMNFNAFKLKKLIVTCYAGSPISGAQLLLPGFEEFYVKPRNEIAYKVELNEVKDWNGDGRADLKDVKEFILKNDGVWEKLEGNGDFRSTECIQFLRQADVVVTNPPFSLFREYVAQLMDFKKHFVIIGNINCITYKEIFPLIKNNKVWLGYGMGRAIAGFMVPNYYELYGTETEVDGSGKKMVSTNQCLWLTNIPLRKYKETLPLVFEYSPELYPKYDNYDAIEVSKTARIPKDYFGVMGVPITFLDKYNPEQFEIVGCTYLYGDCGCHAEGTSWGAQIDGRDIYKRIFIRRRAAE